MAAVAVGLWSAYLLAVVAGTAWFDRSAYQVPATVRVSAPAPLRVLVLGDSLAFGYYASTRATGFVGLLATRLKALRSGSDVVNMSEPGVRVSGVRAQLQHTRGVAGDAVLVVAGSNDVRELTGAYTFFLEERGLVDALHRRYPAAPILMTNIPDVSARYFAIRLPGGYRLAPFGWPLRGLVALDNLFLQNVARHRGVTVVDFHALSTSKGAQDPKYLSFDGLHPNDAGHALIAAYVWPAFARVLRLR